MKSGARWLGLVAVIATIHACQFPSASKKYACLDDADCDPDRVCSPANYCVIPSMEPDAGMVDGGPVDSPPIDGDPFAATRAACIAAGYTQEATTQNYYRTVTTAATWNNAYADCNDDVQGATHLITLSTDAEITLQRMFNEYWVGWIDRPTEGQWHILTDEVTTINVLDHWGNSRPDGGNSENCAIWRNNINGIDDVDCPQSHRYICECDGKPVTKPPT